MKLKLELGHVGNLAICQADNQVCHYSDKPNFPLILAWKCIKLNLLLFKEKRLYNL